MREPKAENRLLLNYIVQFMEIQTFGEKHIKLGTLPFEDVRILINLILYDTEVVESGCDFVALRTFWPTWGCRPGPHSGSTGLTMIAIMSPGIFAG